MRPAEARTLRRQLTRQPESDSSDSDNLLTITNAAPVYPVPVMDEIVPDNSDEDTGSEGEPTSRQLTVHGPTNHQPWLPSHYWEDEMEDAGFDELRTLHRTLSPRKSTKTPTIRSKRTEWSRHRQKSRDKSRNSQRQMPTQTRPFVPDPVGRPLPSIDHEDRCRQPTTRSQRAEINSKMRKEARSKLSDRSRQQFEQTYIPDEIG